MNKACSLRNPAFACWLGGFVLGLCSLALADVSAPDYSTQITPILQQKCLSCHSKATQMGGLVVDSYSAVMKGGDHGPMIVPGKAKESLMVQMLDGTVQPLMPFGADPLPPATVALIKAWIDAGARGPASGEVATPPVPIKVPDAQPRAPGAQTGPNAPKPYASIDHAAITYAGPDRAVARDLKGPEVRVGLMAPLRGPRKAEGEAMLLAARLALEDQTGKLPGGQHLSLAVGDESGQWGRASSEIARLVSDEDAVAIVTSMDGAVAHLAEQIGNRIGVPVLTLSTDSTTTQIDLPWIFRLSPEDRLQAQALARVIYSERGCRRVALVAERDHDGRAGASEFVKAALGLGAPAPERIDLDSVAIDLPQILAAIQSRRPEAVVFWTGSQVAKPLVAALQQAEGGFAVFLCQKAAAGEIAWESDGRAWTVSRGGANLALRTGFRERFRSRAGRPPTSEAAATYDAVSLVIAALRQAGPNRARLRDQLAKISGFAGVSGEVAFDGAGNNLSPLQVVPIPETQ